MPLVYLALGKFCMWRNICMGNLGDPALSHRSHRMQKASKSIRDGLGRLEAAHGRAGMWR